jgi:hypothetical protein
MQATLSEQNPIFGGLDRGVVDVLEWFLSKTACLERSEKFGEEGTK